MAVVDFGDLTAGDPIDDATWVRARGWALTLGLVCLANSFDDPQLEALGRSMVQAALDDDSGATTG